MAHLRNKPTSSGNRILLIRRQEDHRHGKLTGPRGIGRFEADCKISQGILLYSIRCANTKVPRVCSSTCQVERATEVLGLTCGCQKQRGFGGERRNQKSRLGLLEILISNQNMVKS